VHARKDADAKLISPEWRRIKPGTWPVSSSKALKIKLIIENPFPSPFPRKKEPIRAQLTAKEQPMPGIQT